MDHLIVIIHIYNLHNPAVNAVCALDPREYNRNILRAYYQSGTDQVCVYIGIGILGILLF